MNQLLTLDNQFASPGILPLHPDWEKAKRILCVRLDYMGDVLMTTPAIRALRESRPGRRITMLGSGSGAAVARLVPEIDKVISYDPPWVKSTPKRVDSAPDRAVIARLRQEQFDAAVIFTVYSQNPLPAALLCHLADIPLRLAYCRENPYQLLSHRVTETEPEGGIRHEVRRHLDLVATVGASTDNERMSVTVSREVVYRVVNLLCEIGLALVPLWVVIHPGASAASRRYPLEHFAEAARLLVNHHKVQVVFAGSAHEQELVESIRGLMEAPSFSLAGLLDLEELAALIHLTPVLIANNSGPAHLAAALGTPVVDLYALTNPQHTPWGVPSRVLYHDVPCKFCYRSICVEGHHHCLSLVSPRAVVAATLDLLREVQNGGQSEPAAHFAPDLAGVER